MQISKEVLAKLKGEVTAFVPVTATDLIWKEVGMDQLEMEIATTKQALLNSMKELRKALDEAAENIMAVYYKANYSGLDDANPTIVRHLGMQVDRQAIELNALVVMKERIEANV